MCGCLLTNKLKGRELASGPFEAPGYVAMMEFNMLSNEERETFEGFDQMMAEDEFRLTPPMCHLTPMFLDQSDNEQWWECKHCGHTKAIAT